MLSQAVPRSASAESLPKPLEKPQGIPIRYFSLLVLVLQNSTLVILMRVSRMSGEGPMYVASAAVFIMELVKIVACLLLLRAEKRSNSKFIHTLRADIWNQPFECVKMLVPSGLYAIQNNLLYTALTNLDAATFQVTYQLKILTTALFSVLMLGKSLSLKKWFALVLLMVGIAMVQLQSMSEDKKQVGKRQATYSLERVEHVQNPFLGLVSVLAACVSSGFAGVYFEKILKNATTGIWVRNIQLGVFGALFSFMTMMATDGEKVRENGLLHGFNSVTWMVVLNQALGGLIVAMVVRYADNILKGFATSVSILLSAAFAFVLFEFRPSFVFIVGAHIVIGAVYIYGLPDDQAVKLQ